MLSIQRPGGNKFFAAGEKNACCGNSKREGDLPEF
jgi:hypothetical protein